MKLRGLDVELSTKEMDFRWVHIWNPSVWRSSWRVRCPYYEGLEHYFFGLPAFCSKCSSRLADNTVCSCLNTFNHSFPCGQDQLHCLYDRPPVCHRDGLVYILRIFSLNMKNLKFRLCLETSLLRLFFSGTIWVYGRNKRNIHLQYA